MEKISRNNKNGNRWNSKQQDTVYILMMGEITTECVGNWKGNTGTNKNKVVGINQI